MGGHWNSKNENKRSALNYLMQKLDCEEGQMFVQSQCFVIWWIKNASDQVSISSTFYAHIFCAKANWVFFLCLEFGFELTFVQKMLEWKMLMKLTPGLNFINFLCTAFTFVDPKSVKRYWQLDWVLTLWGATGVKAARKYGDEIDGR